MQIKMNITCLSPNIVFPLREDSPWMNIHIEKGYYDDVEDDKATRYSEVQYELETGIDGPSKLVGVSNKPGALTHLRACADRGVWPAKPVAVMHARVAGYDGEPVSLPCIQFKDEFGNQVFIPESKVKESEVKASRSWWPW